MIEKIAPEHILGLDGLPTTIMPDSAKLMRKINELGDAVNTIQKERETERFEIQEWISILESVRKSVNKHEKQIDELQMKVEPEKCEAPVDTFAEQRQWIGCVCRFWYDNPNNTLLDYLDKIQTGKNGVVQYYAKESDDWFPHCEPVLPTDNAIYKGGNNE